MRDGGSVRIDTEGEWVDGEREREREQRGEDEWLLLVAAYDRGRENPEPHVTTYHAQTFFCFVSSIAFLLFLLNTYRHLHGSMTRWYRSRYGAINDLPFLFLFSFLFRRPTLEAHRYSSLYNATYRPSFYWPGCSTWSACAKHISILTNEQNLVCIARRRVFEC